MQFLTAPRAWSTPRVVGYTELVAIVFFAVEAAVLIGMGVVLSVDDPGFDVDEWVAGVGTDGLYLSLATIAAALVCIPFIKFLVGRREAVPWMFLGFARTDVRTLLVWCGLLALFVLASDFLTTALGRPIVPEFMTDAYATAPPVLLFVALVIAAPALEETFFRGFMLRALESSGVAVVVATIVTSLVWAVMHLQYDLYGLVTIFLMGILLAMARLRTQSCFLHCGTRSRQHDRIRRDGRRLGSITRP
jgi:membrane protease YdiL (CAAX protease family)